MKAWRFLLKVGTDNLQSLLIILASIYLIYL